VFLPPYCAQPITDFKAFLEPERRRIPQTQNSGTNSVTTSNSLSLRIETLRVKKARISAFLRESTFSSSSCATLSDTAMGFGIGLLPDLLLPPPLLNKERNSPKKKKTKSKNPSANNPISRRRTPSPATACKGELRAGAAPAIVVTAREDDDYGGGCLLPSPAHL